MCAIQYNVNGDDIIINNSNGLHCKSSCVYPDKKKGGVLLQGTHVDTLF